MPNGGFALEQLKFAPRKEDQVKGRFLGVGAVNYDDRAVTNKDLVANTNSRLVQRQGKKATWPPLPGTQVELEAVSKLADARDLTLLIGSQATTQRVLDELLKARWVLFGTHGFFDNPQRLLGSKPVQFFSKEGGDQDFKLIEGKLVDVRREMPDSLMGLDNSFFSDAGGIDRRDAISPSSGLPTPSPESFWPARIFLSLRKRMSIVPVTTAC